MHLLFEEEGDLKVGAVLSSTDTSFQVELPGGKRTKIKSGHVLLRCERPAGLVLREQAERRRAQVGGWLAGGLPGRIRCQGAQLLLRPDKNSPEYRAVEQAARESKTTALRLLLARGSIVSPYAWHLESFLARCFPRGTGFVPLPGDPPPHDAALALAPVQAFSIDDSSTTEIDDAFSVSRTADGRIRVGIHIAAPATAI